MFGFMEEPNEALSLTYQMTGPSDGQICLETKKSMTQVDLAVADSYYQMEQTYGRVLAMEFSDQPFLQSDAGSSQLFQLTDTFVPEDPLTLTDADLKGLETETEITL